MAVEIADNLTEGLSARIDALGWNELREGKIIAVDSGTGLTRLMAAAASGPQVGSLHPVIPGLFLTEIDPECIGPGKYRLTYTYSRGTATGGGDSNEPTAEGTEIEIGVENEQVERLTDIHDKPMMVGYYVYDPDTGLYDSTTPYIQSTVAPITVVHSTLTITRMESGSPGAKSRKYSGKLNSVVWNCDPTAAPLTWKCEGILGSSRDHGLAYRVVYRFIHSEAGWTHLAQAKDKDTGAPCNLGPLLDYPVTAADGTVFYPTDAFDVIPALDFNELNLP